MNAFSSPYPIRNVSLDTSDIGVKPVFWLYLIQPFNNQPFLTYKMTSDNSRKPDTLTIYNETFTMTSAVMRCVLK